jgi:hypothetical protein
VRFAALSNDYEDELLGETRYWHLVRTTSGFMPDSIDRFSRQREFESRKMLIGVPSGTADQIIHLRVAHGDASIRQSRSS